MTISVFTNMTYMYIQGCLWQNGWKSGFHDNRKSTDQLNNYHLLKNTLL